MTPKTNRKLRRDYNRLFRKDPAAANLFLLLYELADENGTIRVTEAEICSLMSSRFNDPKAYQLSAEPKK